MRASNALLSGGDRAPRAEGIWRGFWRRWNRAAQTRFSGGASFAIIVLGVPGFVLVCMGMVAATEWSVDFIQPFLPSAISSSLAQPGLAVILFGVSMIVGALCAEGFIILTIRAGYRHARALQMKRKRHARTAKN